MTTPLFKSTLWALLAVAILGGLSACKQDVVYQRSMSELNTKAQAMLASGDVDGAVSRLEAAHDLQPNEPNTTYNLAIAYQTQGNYDKALPLLQQLQSEGVLDKGEVSKSLGITYESKADGLIAKARELSEKPKADKAMVERMQSEATQSYQLAIESYQQALPNLKEPEPVKTQIQALETRLKQSVQPAPAATAGQP